jgi:hypothetical protein
MELIASQKSAESEENRADSSIGRALPLQGRGHRFDPCSAYQKKDGELRPQALPYPLVVMYK